MRHQGYKHEVDEEENDDEEETIELRVSASRQDPEPVPRERVARKSFTRLPRFPSSSSFAQSFTGGALFGSAGASGNDHTIHVPIEETRHPAYSTPAGPLMEKLSTLVATGAGVISSTTQMVNLDSMADSVAEAMSLLQNPFGVYGRKKDGLGDYLLDPRLGDMKEQRTRLKLQAFWQLLLTGFEVLRYSAGKRSKKQVLWLDLSGKLYLDVSKKERHAAKCMFWGDVTKVQKGSDVDCFTQSLSWRDAKAKAHLSFSIHGRYGKEDRVFAVQVMQSSVRNVLFENFDALLRLTKGDADGEFPSVAQKVIAQHYATSGDVLTLRQVEDVLLREEEERFGSKDSGVEKKRTGSIPETGNPTGDDGDESDGSSNGEYDEDQRNILG